MSFNFKKDSKLKTGCFLAQQQMLGKQTFDPEQHMDDVCIYSSEMDTLAVHYGI